MLNINDHVRVLSRDKRIFKEGVVVRMTTKGAHIYDPTCVWPLTDSIQNAEWFPFESREQRIVLAGHSARKKKTG